MAKKSQPKSDQPPQVIPNRDLMQRMNFLYQTSVHLSHSGTHAETGRLARKHVKTLKGIATGAVVKIDPTVKRMLCKGCNTVLVPGSSASVRVKTSRPHGKVISYTCFSCHTARVIPAAPTLQVHHQAPHDPGARTSQDAAQDDARGPTEADVESSVNATKADQRRRRRSKARPVPFFARVDAGHVVFRGGLERVDG
ncbi:RNase P Rpr2/Rpp21 subunit domain protein [Rhizoctonia solani 123E]|uniref:RNase P Rpr2/Rpp21 subunit domain protein n=1 Tax=Rhizoctonia solani 123E TaxID=1423351 RepID=A0A074RR87_9AGAM|nr:RNase P Rpr2/Rpp21 subunit domain protein [Rhizoctonia solani 123E]